MINKKSLTISDANLDVIIALNSNSTVIINELVSTSNLRVTCTILNRKATLRVDWY
jgi:S-adenosylmethionine synthetase